MDDIGREEIVTVLFGDEDPLIRNQFIDNYSGELEQFVVLMTHAFEEWARVDKMLTEKKTEPDAYITALLYTALHSHVVSLKLYISGLLVPSGNTQRYVYECVALAFLLSRPSLGVVEKYMTDKYSTTKAVRDVIRNHETLKLNREALKILESSVKFYDKFSHPTRLSLGGIINLSGNGSQIIFGGAYDKDKEFAYEKELKSKMGFAEILPNLIQGVELNYGIEA
jgi:hypothetical protein